MVLLVRDPLGDDGCELADELIERSQFRLVMFCIIFPNRVTEDPAVGVE